MDQAFIQAMQTGYALDEPALTLGGPMLGGEVASQVHVRMALSMVNRHGLIAGATGTGKTKSLQLMAGQLSDAGVPVFISDIKGDVTGIAAPGDATDPRLQARVASLGHDLPAGGPPRRVPVPLGPAGRDGAGVAPLLRAAAAVQGPGAQRHPVGGADAGLPLLRRQPAAAA